MEAVRRAVEAQVLGLTGVALGGIDFENPKGDPGLFGPGAACWRVHGDFTSMMVGGIAALLLQMLHPAALAGVWDHSNFRRDMLGRLRRTAQFISGTTFAPRADAEALIAKVRAIHARVAGRLPDGTPYRADDPALLTWVHVAEVSSFLKSHLRYRNPALTPAEQDRYFREVAEIARRLGAADVPQSRDEAEAYLQAMRPALRCDDRTWEVLRVLTAAPAGMPLPARAFGRLTIEGGTGLLPPWASELLGVGTGPARAALVGAEIKGAARVLRWAVRNGAFHCASRRMAPALAPAGNRA